MRHIVGVAIPSQDVAIRADRGGCGKGSTGKIESSNLSPAQKITVGYTVERIASNHFPTGIDRGHVGEGSAGYRVDRGVLAIAQQKSVPHAAGGVTSHDIVSV